MGRSKKNIKYFFFANELPFNRSSGTHLNFFPASNLYTELEIWINGRLHKLMNVLSCVATGRPQLFGRFFRDQVLKHKNCSKVHQ